MFKILKKIFPSIPSVISMDDTDFGHIIFNPSDADSSIGIWQMNEEWDLPIDNASVSCSSIPGTADGPSDEARTFLISKKHSIPQIWDLVEQNLEAIRVIWRPDTRNQSLREVFKLTSLALDEPVKEPPTWEVSFEPRKGKWIFASIQMVGDKILGDSVDT